MFKLFGKSKEKSKETIETNKPEGEEKLKVISHEFFTEEMYKKLHDDASEIKNSNPNFDIPVKSLPKSLRVDKTPMKSSQESIESLLSNEKFGKLVEMIQEGIEKYNKENDKEIEPIKIQKKGDGWEINGKKVNWNEDIRKELRRVMELIWTKEEIIEKTSNLK